MSDVMLLGILRMPMDLWNDSSYLDKAQRQSNYFRAADKIEALEDVLLEVLIQHDSTTLSEETAQKAYDIINS